MEFFKIVPDKDYSNGPQIINWYGKIDTHKIKYGYAHTLPKRMLLYVESNKELVYPDIVVKPFLLIGEETKKVMSLYKKTIPFNQIILLEEKSKKMKLYYLPFLNQKILEGTNEHNGKKEYCLKEKHEILMREPIFKFQDKEINNVVVRLDLLESILRRKATGFMIEPILIKGTNYE